MSAVDRAFLDQWESAVGRSEIRRERLEVESLRRYALAVGSDPNVEDVEPPLAHWAFFLPQYEDGAIGEDGHPRRGDFLPAITLPRRMFASSQIHFEAPLLLGEHAEQRRLIANVTFKKGNTGNLVFVEVDSSLWQAGMVRVRERQSYVYRGVGVPLPMPADVKEQSTEELWQPGPINLMRFSAATFNSHRIHYDLPYARDVEGYPALVVHGPFTAAKLAAFAAQTRPLGHFSFWALLPLFASQPVHFQRCEGEVRALRCDGAIAMKAEVSYR